jgi:hypothetical protein
VVNSTHPWSITVTVKNTGSADATIDNVLLNGKPFNAVNASLYTSLPISLTVGNSTTIVIAVPSSFASGVSVEVRLHTAGGQEYPKTVTLP